MEMIELTAEAKAEKEAQEREAVRRARLAERPGFSVPIVDDLGNVRRVTLDELNAQKAEQDAFDREVQAAQREQARVELEAARERDRAAEQEAEERAEAFKARKLVDWLAGGFGTRSQFEREWPELRRALFAQRAQSDPDADYLNRKRAEGTYL